MSNQNGSTPMDNITRLFVALVAGRLILADDEHTLDKVRWSLNSQRAEMVGQDLITGRSEDIRKLQLFEMTREAEAGFVQATARARSTQALVSTLEDAVSYAITHGTAPDVEAIYMAVAAKVGKDIVNALWEAIKEEEEE